MKRLSKLFLQNCKFLIQLIKFLLIVIQNFGFFELILLIKNIKLLAIFIIFCCYFNYDIIDETIDSIILFIIVIFNIVGDSFD